MILWSRVRRMRLLVATAATLGAVLVVLGDQEVVVPTVLGGGGGAILWSTLLPLGWAAVVAYSLEVKGVGVEARPSRHVLRWDALAFVLATAGVCLVFATLAPVAGSRLPFIAHLALMAGLTTSVTVLVGATSAIGISTLLMLLTTCYSPALSGARFVRILQPDGALDVSAGVASVVVGCALVLLLTVRRPWFCAADSDAGAAS